MRGLELVGISALVGLGLGCLAMAVGLIALYRREPPPRVNRDDGRDLFNHQRNAMRRAARRDVERWRSGR